MWRLTSPQVIAEANGRDLLFLRGVVIGLVVLRIYRYAAQPIYIAFSRTFGGRRGRPNLSCGCQDDHIAGAAPTRSGRNDQLPYQVSSKSRGSPQTITHLPFSARISAVLSSHAPSKRYCR